MSFQSGTLSLASGITTQAVVFPAAFTVIPDVILPKVFNTSDDPVLLITAEVVARSTSGFTVRLDGATDSADYVLSWMAGSAAPFADALILDGKRLTDLAQKSSLPLPADLFPFTTTYPIPQTVVLRWDLLQTAFACIAAPPANDASAGVEGQVAWDANYFYVRDSSLWRRIPIIPDSTWDSSFALLPRRTGVIPLAMGQQLQTLSFATAFGSGSAPVIKSLVVQNVSSDGAKSVILGMVTATTPGGFTVAFNAAPDSSNYSVAYVAEQPAS